MILGAPPQLAFALLAMTLSGTQLSGTAVPLYGGSLRNNPVFVATHKHLVRSGFGEVLATSNASVTVSVPRGHHTWRLPLQNLTLRAGWYPTPTALAPNILRPGEWVRFIQSSNRLFMTIQPAAFGKLTKNRNQWALSSDLESKISTSRRSWPLSADLPRLGRLPLDTNQNIEVFGTFDGPTIHPTALAPLPMRVSAHLRSYNAGALTLDTLKYGALVYHPSARPSQWLQGLTPGTPLMLLLNPLTRNVLSVYLPGYRMRSVQLLCHNTFGQVVKASTGQLQLKTVWGNQTVNLNGIDIKIRGLHSETLQSLRDLPPRSQVLIHLIPKEHRAVIRILPNLIPCPRSTQTGEHPKKTH